MLVKKVRCLGYMLLVIALAVFLVGCRNPAGDDEYYGGGSGGSGGSTEVQNMPGFPGGGSGGSGGVGGAGGGGTGVATIYEQISFLLDVYNNYGNLAYYDFIVRANLTNETLPAQQDLRFHRNITVRILPPADQTGTRTITGDDGGESLFRIRNGNTLVLHNIIVQERTSPNRSEALFTINPNAKLEMTGYSEITGGRRRAVVVDAGSSLIMRDRAKIHGNSHTGTGGAVQLSGADATLRMYDWASIDNNKATLHGGGVNLHIGSIIMKNNASIWGNDATGRGGGVHIANNNVRLSMYGDASIHSNTAQDGGGAAIMLGGTSPTGYLLMHDNSSIRSNTAIREGGGVFLAYDAGGTVRIYNGTIYGSSGLNHNTAGTSAAIHRRGLQRVEWESSGTYIPVFVGPNIGTDSTISVQNGIGQLLPEA